MANPGHVAILRRGVDFWNQWRRDNPTVVPDFEEVTFSGMHLSNVNLSGANLKSSDLSYATLKFANLSRIDLSFANLNFAKLGKANLSEANLTSASLRAADLNFSNLRAATFSGAKLRAADLSFSNLRSATFSGATLDEANFQHASLYETNFFDVTLNRAICGNTVFADIDLSTARKLDTVEHKLPSTLGMDTIFRSKGKIPDIFLRGCGMPETLITFLPSMMEEAIQFYSCFISYSHADKEFAKRLYDRLQGVGIRCWRDEHQFKPGDELDQTIYDAIRVYDKVILICSKDSLTSWWVNKEFKNAINKEQDYTETVLIPVAVDNYLFEQSADAWLIGEIRRRFVQNFENWKDHDAFEAAFAKVVKALRQDGGNPPPPTPKLTPRK